MPDSQIQVTVKDLADGSEETQVLPTDGYVVVCAGRRHVAHENHFPGSGTVQLTLKIDRGDPS